MRTEAPPPKKEEIGEEGKNVTPNPREHMPLKFAHFTSLNAPKSHILNEVLQTNLIPPSKKSTNLSNANMIKYCKFYCNNDYTTEKRRIIIKRDIFTNIFSLK